MAGHSWKTPSTGKHRRRSLDPSFVNNPPSLRRLASIVCLLTILSLFWTLAPGLAVGSRSAALATAHEYLLGAGCGNDGSFDGSVQSPVSTRGPANAPVTIIEFADFECPFCSKVAPVIGEVLSAYPDKVRFIFKHDPLSIHPHSFLAHEAALAAGAQGKFWEMHYLLFANQARLSRDDLIQYAGQLGLDLKGFRQALDSHLYRPLIETDSAEAKGLGVVSTPTFFINGKRLVGVQGLDVFKAAVGQVLNPVQPAVSAGTGIPKLGPAKEVSIGNAPVRGPKLATITIVEFSDFQCPFCANAVPTMRKLMEQYPDQVKLVFKNFPLDFHRDSLLAHQAAMAAGAQGKFWEMHDRIFGNQRAIKRDDLVQSAKDLGLDVAQFTSDLDSGRFNPAVNADKNEGALLGVSGTPTFFIDGRPLVGAPPLEQFKALIEAELKTPSGVGKAGQVSAVVSRTSATAIRGPAASAQIQTPVTVKKTERPAEVESPTKGPASAPVTMVWYSDFQSPLSPKAYELVLHILNSYPGKVRVVFRNSPLEFHAEAMLAHEAAMAAAAQGKFWEMHDLILSHSNALKEGDLISYGQQVGVDPVKLAKALELHTYRPNIDEDLAEARKHGVFGVPVFFFNGQRLDGVQPLTVVEQLIDSKLKLEHVAISDR